MNENTSLRFDCDWDNLLKTIEGVLVERGTFNILMLDCAPLDELFDEVGILIWNSHKVQSIPNLPSDSYTARSCFMAAIHDLTVNIIRRPSGERWGKYPFYKYTISFSRPNENTNE